ncbi:MAG: hypothetical protein HOV87_34890, partial [Catenulispora sp.]|nr:hypothetical protein [Catenulispora sp.]
MLSPAGAARRAFRVRGETVRAGFAERGRLGARAWFAGRAWHGDGAGTALLVPLAFQIAVLPAASLIYVGGYGAAGNRPVLMLSAMLMAATALLGFGVARGMPPRVLLLGDTVLAVAGNLALSAFAAPLDHAVEVSWQYYAGCVALWTLVRGVPGGLAAAALGIPLRAAMFALSGPVHALRSAAVLELGDTAVSLLAVLVAGTLLTALDRDALRVRTAIRRSLHDTVLQTLEAIAMTLPNDPEQAQRRLREVRAVAHAEAVALRRQLARPGSAGSPPGLVEGLVGVLGELARDGLRVRLDAPDTEHDGLTAERRAAVLAAAREALRNVLKHSGGTEALVRVALND